MISKKDLSDLHAVRRVHEDQLRTAKKLVEVREKDLAEAKEMLGRAQDELDRTLSQLRHQENLYHYSKSSSSPSR